MKLKASLNGAVSCRSSAVITMTGSSRSRQCSRASSSPPSMDGISTSVTTTAGFTRRKHSHAARPSAAVTTANPSSARASATRARQSLSSSTTSTDRRALLTRYGYATPMPVEQVRSSKRHTNGRACFRLPVTPRACMRHGSVPPGGAVEGAPDTATPQPLRQQDELPLPAAVKIAWLPLQTRRRSTARDRQLAIRPCHPSDDGAASTGFDGDWRHQLARRDRLVYHDIHTLDSTWTTN